MLDYMQCKYCIGGAIPERQPTCIPGQQFYVLTTRSRNREKLIVGIDADDFRLRKPLLKAVEKKSWSTPNIHDHTAVMNSFFPTEPR